VPDQGRVEGVGLTVARLVALAAVALGDVVTDQGLFGLGGEFFAILPQLVGALVLLLLVLAAGYNTVDAALLAAAFFAGQHVRRLEHVAAGAAKHDGHGKMSLAGRFAVETLPEL